MMEIEQRARCFHGRMVDGKADFQVYISNECDDQLFEAVAAWADESESVSIAHHFNLPDILADSIDGHERHDGIIDPDAKPIFDAMRNDMLEMIRRIDSLQYWSAKEIPS